MLLPQMPFSTAIPHNKITRWKRGKSGLEKATQVIESAQLIISIGSHDDTLLLCSSEDGKTDVFFSHSKWSTNGGLSFLFSTSILVYWLLDGNDWHFLCILEPCNSWWIWCSEALTESLTLEYLGMFFTWLWWVAQGAGLAEWKATPKM